MENKTSHLRVSGISLGLISMVLLMAGCAVGPNFKSPQSPVGGKWTAADGEKIKGTPADTREWWKIFNDPVLNSLIDQACRQNLGLQAAGAAHHPVASGPGGFRLVVLPGGKHFRHSPASTLQ